MADQTFSPELLQALAQAGLLPQIMELAQGQMATGQKMADTPMPEGQVYQPGYQAPHPLEYVAAILRRGQGQRQAAAGSQRAEGAVQGYGKTALDYYQALAQAARGPQAPTGQHPDEATMFGPR